MAWHGTHPTAKPCRARSRLALRASHSTLAGAVRSNVTPTTTTDITTTPQCTSWPARPSHVWPLHPFARLMSPLSAGQSTCNDAWTPRASFLVGVPGGPWGNPSICPSTYTPVFPPLTLCVLQSPNMNYIRPGAAATRQVAGKTAIVTGAAGAIGAAICQQFAQSGANVVLADLSVARESAQSVIQSLVDPSRAMFVSTDISSWDDMKALFNAAVRRFGSVEFVIANAAVMESTATLGTESLDSHGDPLPADEAHKVIDVNLKGSLSGELSTCPAFFLQLADQPLSAPFGSASHAEQ